MKKPYGAVSIVAGFLLLLLPVAGVTAEIRGVSFADTLQTEGAELTLKGTAVLEWARLFDVYAGALYLPLRSPDSDWRDDVPKRLELAYFREISARDFAESSDKLLRRNLSAASYQALEDRLERFYRWFRDVQPGDRYALTYRPGDGTELRLNGQLLGSVPGHDFAAAYFGLWLGESPISEHFRNRLLGAGGG